MEGECFLVSSDWRNSPFLLKSLKQRRAPLLLLLLIFALVAFFTGVLLYYNVQSKRRHFTCEQCFPQTLQRISFPSETAATAATAEEPSIVGRSADEERRKGKIHIAQKEVWVRVYCNYLSPIFSRSKRIAVEFLLRGITIILSFVSLC